MTDVVETVPAALDGQRIDRLVAMATGLPRAEVSVLIDAGAVRVAGATVTSRSRRVREGEVVEVAVPEVRSVLPGAEAAVAVPVVYEDADLVVVDKPAGLVVHPGAGNEAGTLVNGLLARYPEMASVGEPGRPGLVHRLDKGTSGLLVVARTEAAYHQLVAMMSARGVTRGYLALVEGEVESASGVVDAPVGRSARQPTKMAVSAAGREARTSYTVVERLPGHTLLQCLLETGRTHQIRVHLAAIGHPVAGDAQYRGHTTLLGRPFLHAATLGFSHPITGVDLSFASALPADLEAVLERLRAGA